MVASCPLVVVVVGFFLVVRGVVLIDWFLIWSAELLGLIGVCWFQ